MKFKVREGFVVRLSNRVDLGDGKTEVQETTAYAGQTINVDAATADLHAHKLEPADKEAAAFLEAKVLPVSAASSIGVTPEMLALAKAMAVEIVGQIMAAQAAPTPA